MKKLNKKDMKKWWKVQEQKAKEFKLTAEDLHNLMDLFYMVDNPPEMQINFRKTLKLNKMDKWFNKLFGKIEDICLDEGTESMGDTN